MWGGKYIKKCQLIVLSNENEIPEILASFGCIFFVMVTIFGNYGYYILFSLFIFASCPINSSNANLK